MTKQTRRLIFYIFLAIFILLATGIIFYAQGYDFDWKTKSLFMGGAFYFKSCPKEADIYINNEYYNKTNKLIKRFPPKKYNIKISKPDYYDWQKTLEIKSRLVTEAKNILLIKKNPQIDLITENNVKYFSVSPNKKRLIYVTSKPRNLLRLIDNDTDTQIYPSNGIPPTLDFNMLISINWSPDNEKTLLSFADNNYYVLNLKNRLEIIHLNKLIEILSKYKIYDIKNLTFHPHDPNQIYFYSKKNLYVIKLNDSNNLQSIISLALSDVLTYTIHNTEILYIKYSNGEFYKTDFDGSYFKKILDIPFFETEKNISIINDKLLLIEGNLYLYNFQAQILGKIAKNVIDTNFSDDEQKLLWRTENEIGVIWLEDDSEPPIHQKYDAEIVIQELSKINQAVWYSKTNNQHIIFATENEIQITELDSRNGRNTANIFSGENLKAFYNKDSDEIYLLDSEEGLLRIKICD